MNSVLDGAVLQSWEIPPHLSSGPIATGSNLAGQGAGPGPQEALIMPSVVYTAPKDRV